MKYVDATSLNDVGEFANQLDNSPHSTKVHLVAYTLSEGLMQMPFPFGILTGLLKLVRGKDGIKKFVYIISNAHVDIFNQMYNDTISHMLYGTDREDKNSVGGFSQRELNLICNNIYG